MTCHLREKPPADGENTTCGSSAALTPLAPGQGEHLGRSPDSRVDAWPDLPTTQGVTVAYTGFALRLQLRGQPWIWPVGRTTFPFNRTANRPDRSNRLLQEGGQFGKDQFRFLRYFSNLVGALNGRNLITNFTRCNYAQAGISERVEMTAKPAPWLSNPAVAKVRFWITSPSTFNDRFSDLRCVAAGTLLQRNAILRQQ